MSSHSSSVIIPNSWSINNTQLPEGTDETERIELPSAYSEFSSSVTRGDSVAGWRERIANGDNATTPLNGSKWTVHCVPGKVISRVHSRPEYGNLQRSYVTEGNIGGYFIGANRFATSPTIDLYSATNQAAARFTQNVRSEETDFAGFVTAGELPETLNLLRHPAQALRRGMSDYLSALKRGGRRVPRAQRPSFVRKTWLEYSFGWKPLISDIEDAQKLLVARIVPPRFSMVKGTARVQQPHEPLHWPIHFGAHLGGFNVSTTEEAFTKYFGVYEHRGNGTSKFVQAGFRPAEFIPSLWELIPYSFLVDYFTNIGDIVASWSYRFASMKWVAGTFRREFVMACESSALNPRTDYWQPSEWDIEAPTGSAGSAFAKYTQVVRTPDVPFPIPSLELQAPGFGSTKWVNIAALSAQLGSTRRSLRF